MRVEGGPADGAEVRPRKETFQWLDRAGNSFVSPGPGRGRYLRVGPVLRFSPYLCQGCGAVLEPQHAGRPLYCPLCGAEARPEPAPEPPDPLKP